MPARRGMLCALSYLALPLVVCLAYLFQRFTRRSRTDSAASAAKRRHRRGHYFFCDLPRTRAVFKKQLKSLAAQRNAPSSFSAQLSHQQQTTNREQGQPWTDKERQRQTTNGSASCTRIMHGTLLTFPRRSMEGRERKKQLAKSSKREVKERAALGKYTSAQK